MRSSLGSVCSALSTPWTTSEKAVGIGAARTLLGSLLSIKPIIEIRDGVAEADTRQRTRAGSLEYLVNKLRQAGKLDGLAVVHAAAPDLDVFLEMLTGVFPPGGRSRQLHRSCDRDPCRAPLHRHLLPAWRNSGRLTYSTCLLSRLPKTTGLLN